MVQTTAGRVPIPPAKKDDSEDVAWALSTAEAMYARGDRSDALKWLRRAAEAASSADADDRALELAKAAADLAGAIGPITTAPPPPPPPPPAAPSRPAPQIGIALQAGTAPPAPASRPALQVDTVPPPPPSSRSLLPNVTPPSPHVFTRPIGQAQSSVPPVTPPRSVAPDLLSATASDDMDQWPTHSLGRDDLENPNDRTTMGVPTYEANAKRATDAPEPMPRTKHEGLLASQAIRVVVWRGADGVHVAPHGTRVAAITVDAMLVGLDPDADLAAWLSGK